MDNRTKQELVNSLNQFYRLLEEGHDVQNELLEVIIETERLLFEELNHQTLWNRFHPEEGGGRWERMDSPK